MNGRIQQIELPGGAVVHARLSAPGGGYWEDEEDVGVGEQAVARVRQLRELIAGIGDSVLQAAAAAGPDEASVTFGIELTAKSGAALAVLATGESKASVQVSLTWYLHGQQPGHPHERLPGPGHPDAPPGPSPSPSPSPLPSPGTDGQGTPVPTPAVPPQPPNAPPQRSDPVPAPPRHPPAPTNPISPPCPPTVP
ncbi:CU044_2847 family protein [Streptomyces sp. NPDC005953]|uniref:CU044_2847 family protein n=1 Tax=Streptomyces sp. NPDC005953 TaxID=3156719 RepID=UPI003400DE5B